MRHVLSQTENQAIDNQALQQSWLYNSMILYQPYLLATVVEFEKML